MRTFSSIRFQAELNKPSQTWKIYAIPFTKQNILWTFFWSFNVFIVIMSDFHLPPPSFVPRFPFQVVLAACGAVGMLHTMKPAFLVFFVSAVQQRRELHSKDVRGKNEAQKRSSDILRPFYCPKKTSKSLDFSLQGALRPFPR